MPTLLDQIKGLFKGKANRQPKAGDTSHWDRRLLRSLSVRRLPTAKQLKHLPRFLSPQEKKTINILMAIIAVGLLAIGGKYYNDHVRLVPADGGDYSEGVIGSPHYLNPILAATNDADSDLVALVFSGLMRVDVNGQLVPDLAKKFEISTDGKTYTFVLRQNLQWHDGTELTAHDAVTTFNYIKDPSWRSPYYSRFRNVSVEATDDMTVKFTLAEPYAPFLSLLTVGLLPEHLWQDIRPENAARSDLNTKPIGSGPFRFKTLIKDKKGAIRSYTLTRNDDYYGERPHLDTFTLKFYPDAETAFEAFAAKHVDGLGFLPTDARDKVMRERAVRLYDLRLSQYTAVFFNLGRDTALRQKEVRQALAWAVDREKVCEVAPGSTAVYGPVLPGLAAFSGDTTKYRLNRQQAGTLLDQVGWKLDSDGFRKKEATDTKTKVTTKTPLIVKLTTVDAAENRAVAEAVARDWEAVGVKTEIVLVPAAHIKDTVRERDYDALLYGEIVGPDPDPYPFWHSSQASASGFNLSGFSNRRADELLEQARRTLDEAKRTNAYREFQNILADEAPAVILYRPAYTYAVSRDIKGIESGLVFSPSDRFAGVTGWYVKTERVWR
ncbi:MAG: ABC transporter substrate-binding protein [Patescibacteria group bacterium]|nr:ABC transporter substrate-binding protein [Patescibacteria group bacterium]